MPRIFILFLAFAVGPAVASDKSDVEAVVRQWTSSFNKGDFKATAATCADEATITDDIPPYEWHGRGACATWIDAFQAAAKQGNFTFDHAEILKFTDTQVTGDAAYVSALLKFATKNKEGVVEADKGHWTLVLKKSGSAWRIINWAWVSMGPEKPAKS